MTPTPNTPAKCPRCDRVHDMHMTCDDGGIHDGSPYIPRELRPFHGQVADTTEPHDIFGNGEQYGYEPSGPDERPAPDDHPDTPPLAADALEQAAQQVWYSRSMPEASFRLQRLIARLTQEARIDAREQALELLRPIQGYKGNSAFEVMTQIDAVIARLAELNVKENE